MYEEPNFLLVPIGVTWIELNDKSIDLFQSNRSVETSTSKLVYTIAYSIWYPPFFDSRIFHTF